MEGGRWEEEELTWVKRDTTRKSRMERIGLILM